jgi:23S rRNA pseudouridine2605 synthase
MATKATKKPTAAKKPAKRAKKQAEPGTIQVTAVEDAAPRHEPDEPELNAAAQSAHAGSREPAGTPVAPQAEAELLAEAADTFEQAYEERRPAEHEAALAADANTPEPTNVESQSEGEDAASEPGEFLKPEKAPRTPARLDRLQKILSQAGVASRRHAEEMITQGRVQVNGTVVTELGTKADPEHDHIRVDGKLIRGAEHLRYFVLNKPKGHVTTASDPEGRPTVMDFFKKMSERLYPVGRLDFLSEGLLLVTNDGDLANKLTKAATGVEKTYLVKVSGQPTEEELDRLREGVGIDRGRPGEGRVHTSPATIRQARAGDNPWYEVVLTEGRNRELRKMFEEIGHFVEKIRRVGYGPLVLDVEPGQFRELEADELAKLRLAAEGKWRKPKPREPRAESRQGARREGGRGPAREGGGRQPVRGERTPAQRPPEDRLRTGERADRGGDRSRPAQGKREWRPAQARDQGFQRPRFKPADRGEGFGRSAASRPAAGRPAAGRPTAGGARPPQSGRPPRSGRPEGGGQGWVRREGSGRPAVTPKYQENRPRFEAREDRRGRVEKPRRGPAPPPGRFESTRTEGPSRTERPSRPERPAGTGRSSFPGREQTSSRGYRGGSGGGSQTGGRNAGQQNRFSGPGRAGGPSRGGTGPARPPFKSASGGGRTSSRPRTNPPRGPRGRRP